MKQKSQLVAKITSGKKLEWFAFALYIVLFCIISAFHEPWYDEAQSWQIAKTASLSDILFMLPHYEGHPPLWHLILIIPARLGVPYELGLKATGALFSFAAAYLMIFKSKLPRLARLVLPFMYFFFYQYGIITRPYAIMLLVILLLGMNLDQREHHPWRISLLLCALCLTSAYGMLIAAGIALCITWEILRDKGFTAMLRELFSDSRTASLLALLLLAVLLTIEIWPSDQAYASNMVVRATLPTRLAWALLAFPSECFLSTSLWFSYEHALVQAAPAVDVELIGLCAVGVVIWCVVICSSSRRGLKYLLVPYALFALFSAVVYFSTHHIGIIFLIFLLFAELMSRDEQRLEIGLSVRDRIAQTERDATLAKWAYLIIVVACIAMPLYWSAYASVLDIQHQYGFARTMASFLKEKHLDDANIFVVWSEQGSLCPASGGHDDYINTELMGGAPPLLAYFDHNILMNFHEGRHEDAYVLHKMVDYEESRATVQKWREAGIPDVLIGRPDLSKVYGDEISLDDYSCVCIFEAGNIWKTRARSQWVTIYVKNDLLDQYGLDVVDDSAARSKLDGLTMTSAQMEAIRNGADPNVVLDAQLDEIFGEN